MYIFKYVKKDLHNKAISLYFKTKWERMLLCIFVFYNLDSQFIEVTIYFLD